MISLAAKSARSRSPSMARFEARVSRDFKKTLEQAAAVTGHPTVTSFVLFTLQASARKVIEEHQRAMLSAAESTHFVKALLAPPAPNPALRTAFRRYRKEVKVDA